MANTCDNILSQIVYLVGQSGLFSGFQTITIRNANAKFGPDDMNKYVRFMKLQMPAVFVEIGQIQNSINRTLANYALGNSITFRKYQVIVTAATNLTWLQNSNFTSIHDIENALNELMRVPSVQVPYLQYAPNIWNFEFDDNPIYDQSGQDPRFNWGRTSMWYVSAENTSPGGSS